MFCTKCGQQLQAPNIPCPRCGGRGLPSSPPQYQPAPMVVSQTSKDWSKELAAWNAAPLIAKVLIGIMLSLGAMGVLFGIADLVHPNKPTTISSHAAMVQAAPIVGPSFQQCDAMMDSRRTDLTDAQRDAYWTTVQGTRIKWAGEVTDVQSNNGGEIDLKCNPKSYVTDVRVALDGSQAAQLTTISKGQRVTFEGILNGHGLFGYRITQGQITGI